MSWDEQFSLQYDDWSADMTEDVPFYVGLAQAIDGPHVELAIGNGRVAFPVSRVTGRAVIWDRFLSGNARSGTGSSPGGRGHSRSRQGDMQDLELDEPAGLIYCPFRPLLRLPTWADRRCTFGRVATALRPGGRFAWNAFAFDHDVAARLDGQHLESRFPHSVHHAVADNRIDLTLDAGGTSQLWWATKNEWLGLIDVAGLELETP